MKAKFRKKYGFSLLSIPPLFISVTMIGIAARFASKPALAYQIPSFVRYASTIKVFGHKVPDTDAICGAMVRAWELEQHGEKATAYRLGDLNKETEFVLNTFALGAPPLLETLEAQSRVAIVDTNNPKELPEGLGDSEVMSIVDHHKLCGLSTDKPLDIDIRPLCSTGSILYARMKVAGIEPTKTMAGLMLSCILSDSLEFRSPTTTPTDKVYAEELAKLSGLNISEHAAAMFAAKADIGHLSPEQVVMMDSKIFDIGGRQLRVSVVETTAPAIALTQKSALQEGMKEIAKEQKLDDVLLFVVDILKEEAVFVSSTPAANALVEKAWGVPVAADGLAVIPGVLSRKKQIIPSLEKAAK
ncbi:hypothetical protein CYMTET_25175 [Cymbomonas tetramitiformis]|uniref:inorganic diphosphatase n=1 Tax=Cymbomonas tetramitiformis TaxID=36881 RepID=A0AAE0FUM9_9CHLO|nr:hypothetical protein CYMTET_25175 [Cymbomonas tetramitiformis]|eukprot:gene15142-17912_t